MKIVIPGEPVSQIRMKYSGINGVGRVYDPRAKIKKELKGALMKEFSGVSILLHPRVSFVFYMPIPKSTPKKLLSLYKSGLLKHEKKPDVDNFIKLYLDCLDTILFEGDQKVSLGNSIKLYHPEPKTVIILEETSEILSHRELDSVLEYSLFEKEFGKCSYVETIYRHDYESPDDRESLLFDGKSDLVQKVHTLPTISLVRKVSRSKNQVSEL